MKNLTLSILILVFSISAQAGEKIDKSLAVAATADVSIEDIHAQIEILSWNKAMVKVTGNISSRASGYKFEKSGNNVVFEVKYDDHTGWRDSDKLKDPSKLKFYVPVKSRLETSNVSGDITVTGIEGGTSIESVSGNINAEKLKHRISLETVNGSITTKNLEGKIEIETVNGNITDKNSSGELELEAVQGDISSDSRCTSIEIEIVNGNLDLQLDKIDELSIESVNGKVSAAMHLNKKGEVSVSNVNGNIELLFNKNVSADFELAAFVGGSIVNKLTADQAEKKKFQPGRSLSFSKDGGSGRVEVNTVSGKVQVGPR
jgi:DUF4097 and DUF4098 domain-containing protein YvlB